MALLLNNTFGNAARFGLTRMFRSADFVLGHSALLTYDPSSVIHPT